MYHFVMLDFMPGTITLQWHKTQQKIEIMYIKSSILKKRDLEVKITEFVFLPFNDSYR